MNDEKKITHIDLFSGIGGFSLALDTIFYDYKIEHIFCDNNPFAQAVLKKHWGGAEINGDIRTLTNTRGTKSDGISDQSREKISANRSGCFILTGGFPCQPFSAAGRRKGTQDDRYLWPEMYRVIGEYRPEWVVAENVRGLTNWNNGMVLEQVCTDLESEGYEIQPIIIPAVAVNAPHRRDRVWFIAHAEHGRQGNAERGRNDQGASTRIARPNQNASDTNNARGGTSESRDGEGEKKSEKREHAQRGTGGQNIEWNKNWFEVATEFCQFYDGVSDWLDGHINDVIYLEDYETIKKNKGQSLQILWKELQSPQVRREIGGLFKIQNEEVLLEVVCQLRAYSQTSQNIPFTGEKVCSGELRELWLNGENGCPPQGWGYYEQQVNELKNIMPSLSYEASLAIAKVWYRTERCFNSAIAQSARMGDTTISRAKHRNEQLKAYGNAVVPQVAMEIFQAIKQFYE